MYYAVWFGENAVLADTFGYTNNIRYLKDYIFLMTTRLLKSIDGPSAYYEECSTLEDVEDVLSEKCGADLKCHYINEYEILLYRSQTRPELYTLMTLDYESEIMEVVDYGGGYHITLLAKVVSQLRQVMSCILKKTHTTDVIVKGADRVADYLFAYGVIELYYEPISTDSCTEEDLKQIVYYSEELNIDILDVVEIDNGFGIIEDLEYINAYVLYDQLWINREVES